MSNKTSAIFKKTLDEVKSGDSGISAIMPVIAKNFEIWYWGKFQSKYIDILIEVTKILSVIDEKSFSREEFLDNPQKLSETMVANTSFLGHILMKLSNIDSESVTVDNNWIDLMYKSNKSTMDTVLKLADTELILKKSILAAIHEYTDAHVEVYKLAGVDINEDSDISMSDLIAENFHYTGDIASYNAYTNMIRNMYEKFTFIGEYCVDGLEIVNKDDLIMPLLTDRVGNNSMLSGVLWTVFGMLIGAWCVILAI